MAVARMTQISDKITVQEGPTDLLGLKHYLKFYTEFKPYVDKLLVCDPYSVPSQQTLTPFELSDLLGQKFKVFFERYRQSNTRHKEAA